MTSQFYGTKNVESVSKCVISLIRRVIEKGCAIKITDYKIETASHDHSCNGAIVHQELKIDDERMQVVVNNVLVVQSSVTFPPDSFLIHLSI
jgi:hypothetical protein